jgi:hypothetical protein
MFARTPEFDIQYSAGMLFELLRILHTLFSWQLTMLNRIVYVVSLNELCSEHG